MPQACIITVLADASVDPTYPNQSSLSIIPHAAATLAFTLWHSIYRLLYSNTLLISQSAMAEEKDLAHLQPDGPPSMPKICIGIGLGGAHHDVLIRAISNVLSTKIAEETFAQIIDGLPLASVVQDTSDGGLTDDHPIHDAHKELCPGVLEKTREFRRDVDLSLIKLDSTVSDVRGLLMFSEM